MKYKLNKIRKSHYFYDNVYELLDYEGNIILSSEDRYVEIKFLSDSVIYFRKFSHSPVGKDYCYFDEGILDLNSNEIFFKTTASESESKIEASTYSDGLLRIHYKADLLTFIDEQGKTVLELMTSFKNVGDFEEGLASIRNPIIDYYLFDFKTNLIRQLNEPVRSYFKDVKYFEENQPDNKIIENELIPYYELLENDFIGRELWGYKNSSGEIAIEARFEEVKGFNEGVAAVHDYVQEKFYTNDGHEFSLRRWGYINSKGEYIIKPKFTSVTNFSFGLAMVTELKNGKYLIGVINKSGDYLIRPQFCGVEKTQNSRFGLLLKRTFGFINKKGEQKIDFNYEDVDSFRKGKCLVMKNGLWGIIDKNDKWIIEPTFESKEKCSEQSAKRQ